MGDNSNDFRIPISAVESVLAQLLAENHYEEDQALAIAIMDELNVLLAQHDVEHTNIYISQVAELFVQANVNAVSDNDSPFTPIQIIEFANVYANDIFEAITERAFTVSAIDSFPDSFNYVVGLPPTEFSIGEALGYSQQDVHQILSPTVPADILLLGVREELRQGDLSPEEQEYISMLLETALANEAFADGVSQEEFDRLLDGLDAELETSLRAFERGQQALSAIDAALQELQNLSSEQFYRMIFFPNSYYQGEAYDDIPSAGEALLRLWGWQQDLEAQQLSILQASIDTMPLSVYVQPIGRIKQQAQQAYDYLKERHDLLIILDARIRSRLMSYLFRLYGESLDQEWQSLSTPNLYEYVVNLIHSPMGARTGERIWSDFREEFVIRPSLERYGGLLEFISDLTLHTLMVALEASGFTFVVDLVVWAIGEGLNLVADDLFPDYAFGEARRYTMEKLLVGSTLLSQEDWDEMVEVSDALQPMLGLIGLVDGIRLLIPATLRNARRGLRSLRKINLRSARDITVPVVHPWQREGLEITFRETEEGRRIFIRDPQVADGRNQIIGVALIDNENNIALGIRTRVANKNNELVYVTTHRSEDIFNILVADGGGSNLNGIYGIWGNEPSLRSNLDTFNAFIAEGATPEQAALRTFTGRNASEWGFTNVRIVQSSQNARGEYTSVRVLFTQP